MLYSLLPLLFLTLITAKAIANEPIIRSFGKYRLEMKNPGIYNPSEISSGKLFESGKEIAQLDAVVNRHYYPFEVQNNKLFWIVRLGDYQKTDKWEDQLWVMDLNSKKKEKLISQKGMDFRASSDGKRLIYICENAVCLLDIESKKQSTVSKKEDSADGYTLLGWASDSKKVWFAKSVLDSWEKLAIYEEGKVKWLDFEGGSEDEAFDPDRGWLVKSNAPSFFDAEDRKEFKKSDQKISLTITEVLTGKTAELANAKANYFNPVWVSNDLLEYKIKGKRYKLTAIEIKAKLN